MEKINIAELLRDCPQGMGLDCTCADNVVFDKIIEYEQIKCVIGECRDPLILDKYGRLLHICCPKCVIFPKGKTNWKGFVSPCKFKDGDVVSYGDGWTCIFKCIHGVWYSSYCFITSDGEFHTGYEEHEINTTINGNVHPATKEQCNLFFQKIKEAGYKWNPETKKLEKLIKPYFKIGDEIVKKNSITNSYIVSSVSCDYYGLKLPNNTGVGVLKVDEQDEWVLVSNKFDITTLKPFESRVLVRDDNCYEWEADIFGRYSDGYITLGGGKWNQCIPYEGNEHLFGTTNDCDEFYKTWE